MKRLTAEQLRPGVPTWHTTPEPLGQGRIIVCDILNKHGRIETNGWAVDPLQMYLNRNPGSLSYFLHTCIHYMQRGQNAKASAT